MKGIRHILFAVNPAAGEGKLRDRWNSAKKSFEGYDMFMSKTQGEITEFLKEKSGRYDLVVAVGGDGTVNECANGIMKSGSLETMLFNLPFGVGNDFAINLGISEKPYNLKKYCENLREGKNMHVKEMDVWQVDNRCFLNYASIGFCAKTLDERNKTNFLNGKAKFFFAALMNCLSYKPIEAEIGMGEKKIRSSIFSMIMTNGKYFGGGMRISPEAAIDDGLLNISIVRPSTFPEYVEIWLNSYKEERTGMKNMHFYKSDSINITSREMMPLQIDGEYLGERREISIAKADRRIKALMPLKS